MATESTLTTTPSTLVEELVERTRLSWAQVAVAVSLGVTLFLVGTAYLAGVLAGPFNAVFWRVGMLFPGIIVYLLLIQPVLRRLRDDAIGCCPLVPMDDHDFHRLVAQASIFNRRREWLALGIGAVGGLLLWRPWDYYGPSGAWSLSAGGSGWLVLYALLPGGLMYGLLGWFIYSSLSGTKLFAELHHHALDIDIFDLGSLEPIGRWSLGIALSYIGGITLSLLFIPRFTPTIENIILYGTLTLVSVLVFFLNMMSTHHVMVEAKKRELSMVRDKLVAASQALKQRGAKGQGEGMEALSDSISILAWEAYEKRVKAVPEWPYTESIIRTLVASLLVPVAIFTVQGVLVSLLLRLLSVP